MLSIAFWALLFIGVLYWEYKLSRPAKFFIELKKEEPDAYDLIHRGSVLPPGAIFKGMIANNQHMKIKSERLKEELLSIDSGNARYAVMSMYLFVAFVLVSLLIRAVGSV